MAISYLTSSVYYSNYIAPLKRFKTIIFATTPPAPLIVPGGVLLMPVGNGAAVFSSGTMQQHENIPTTLPACEPNHGLLSALVSHGSIVIGMVHTNRNVCG